MESVVNMKHTVAFLLSAAPAELDNLIKQFPHNKGLEAEETYPEEYCLDTPEKQKAVLHTTITALMLAEPMQRSMLTQKARVKKLGIVWKILWAVIGKSESMEFELSSSKEKKEKAEIRNTLNDLVAEAKNISIILKKDLDASDYNADTIGNLTKAEELFAKLKAVTERLQQE